MGSVPAVRVAAAAMVGAALLGCGATGAGAIPGGTASPTARTPVTTTAPKATAVATPGALSRPAPPAGLPVFYIARPGDHALTAVDDRAGTVGAVVVDRTVGYRSERPSPDGAYLLAGGAGGSSILDQRGRQQGTPLPRGGAQWADDSRHICVATYPPDEGPNSVQQLDVVTVAGATRVVTALPGHVSGDSAISVIACSPTNDRVVLTRTVCCSTVWVAVMQLSTGRTLFEQMADRNSELEVTSSLDARYITVATQRASAGTTSPTTCQVRDSATGRAASPVLAGVCRGLGADGSQLLLDVGSSGHEMTRLVDRRTGSTKWTVPATIVGLSSGRDGRSVYIAGSGYVTNGDQGGTYAALSLVGDGGTLVPVATGAYCYASEP